MKRSFFELADPFVMAPALVLVPSVGQISRLAGLQASLHARAEKVAGLRSEFEKPGQVAGRDREASRRLAAEDAMITTVLDWLRTHAPSES
jgi:hypothetical protein